MSLLRCFRFTLRHFPTLFDVFSGISKKTPQESSRLAESVGHTCTLLRRILAENKSCISEVPTKNSHGRHASGSVFVRLMEKILDECHQTFVKCFHALYPTASLKWTALCQLLGQIEPVSLPQSFELN